MSVTARQLTAARSVTATPRIRPPDPKVDGETTRYGEYSSAEATRRYIDLAYRDCHTALDLTHGAGRFWERPYPPGLTVITNNRDPRSPADLHLDFTNTGLVDQSYDLVIYDPPHVADLGATSFYLGRYGSARSSADLFRLVTAGVREAWRLAAVGVLVKVADSNHGGVFLELSRWVADELDASPYFVAHTVRPSATKDPKHKVQRVPKNNGAVYLIYRKDGARHLDFDRRYARQMSRLAPLLSVRRCAKCDNPIGAGRRSDATTCSDRCRQRLRRQRHGETF